MVYIKTTKKTHFHYQYILIKFQKTN